MAVSTYTHGGTGSQPFGSASGIKFIDNFSSTNLTTSPVDPYTGVGLYLVNQVKMYMGGTSGSAGAARLGLWFSAGAYVKVANQTINGVAATVSSATVLETATLNAVIQSGKTYYAGGWASASLASKRDTATGSFSSYTGNGTSTTVGTTYNPGNLYFQILYYYLPTAPGTPTVTSKTSTSATISWTAPSNDGGTAVTAYKIQYSTDNTNWTTWNEGTYSTTPSTSATITGLTPGQTYYFRVSAKNAVVPGYGDGVSLGNGTGGSFTSLTYTDASAVDWIYNSYSSGPYSTASAATKLPGGIYNGTTWAPLTSRRSVVFPSTSYSGGYIWDFNNLVTLNVTSATQPVNIGDVLVVKVNGSDPYGVTGSWGVANVTNTGGTTWAIDFYISYFNANPYTIAINNGTVVGERSVSIKVYNGTGWTTYV